MEYIKMVFGLVPTIIISIVFYTILVLVITDTIHIDIVTKPMLYGVLGFAIYTGIGMLIHFKHFIANR